MFLYIVFEIRFKPSRLIILVIKIFEWEMLLVESKLSQWSVTASHFKVIKCVL